MKLVLFELLLIIIAVACVLEIVYLAWLSATPITSERLSIVRLEYYVALSVLAITLVIGIALPFFAKRK
jgi:hypothetical protein